MSTCTETKVAYVHVAGEAVAWDFYDGADPNGPILATLVNATERSIRIELDGTGSGNFSINRYADEATAAVLKKGNIVKVRYPEIGPDYIFAFILESGDFTLVSSNEEGGEMLSFGGRGILAYLDRAIMWNEAFTTGPDVSDTWTQLWQTTAVSAPSGTAFVSSESGYIYVLGMRTRRIYKVSQSTRAVVSSSPVLWSDSTHYAAGLSTDPSDATIFWVLEAPWLSGSSANTRIRKIRKSDWVTTANFDLGSAIKHTAIKADSSVLWLTRYDGTTTIYKRSKSTGSVTTSYSISYGGVTQTKANGISVNGTELAYWFSGTKRALIADSSAPTTILRKISTQTISAFGGEWTTESGNQFFYMDSYSAGIVWKYQLTSASPHDPVDGIWRLDEGTPGAILARLMAEWKAVARPQQPIPDTSYLFDFVDDSDGNAWSTHDGTLQFDARVRDPGLDTVLRLIPYGLKLQMSPYLVLGGYNSFGTTRTSGTFAAGKVRFVKGTNIADELRRRLDERTVHSHMLAEGDGIFATAEDDDFGYVREGGIGTQLDDATALAGTAEVELERERLIADGIAFAVTWADSELSGGYLPGPAGTNGHYWVGDVIRLHTGTGEFDYDEQNVTVYAITLTEQENGEWKPLVELRTGFIPELPPFFESGGSGSGSSNGTSSGTTSTIVTGTRLTVTDGDIDIPQVTRIEYEGAYSPTPGTAILPRGSTDAPLIEDLLTDESDDTLVYAPDGFGGVVARAETGGSGALPWFNVMDPAYGAVNDNSTDDTAAINLAIADLNTAGFGVLYFPAGTGYKCTSALTTITAFCTVMGDGGSGDGSTHIFGTPATQVIQTSQTANLFTVSARGCTFRDISLGNAYAGSPSAGAGISMTDAYFARLTRISVANFYDNISISDGAGWALTDSFIYDPVRYGLRIQGTVSPDSGDQSIIGSYFMSGVHNGTAAIRFESAGGLKIANTKINNRNGSAHFVDGIQVAIPTATNTSVLMIGDVSIENVTGDAIDISTTGTATFGLITISGLEVGLYSNNSGRAVKVTAAAAGGFGTPGGITGILIDGLVARTDGTARAAVELTNTDLTTLGEMVLVGFNARYTSSGDTNTTDTTTSSTLTIKDEGSSLATLATSLDFVGAGVVASGTGAAKTITIAGGASFATPAIVLGTAAAAGAAATVIRSDSTIVAFDATAPTDIPGPGVASAAGSVAFAARRDHKHALTYHDEPLTDGASNFIFDGGDIVVVTGVPN